jgi:uncharacterized protein
MNKKPPLKDILFNWKHISGFKKRNITYNNENFVLTEYYIKSPKELQNKTVLFFADTHFRDLQFPYTELAEFINTLKTDWLIFGGDLINYLSYCGLAVEFLSKLKAKTAKLAVLGNWEAQKYQWTMPNFWNTIYEKSGFQLLIDTISDIYPIRFIGLTPYMKTNRLPPPPPGYYTCLISHSPDNVIKIFNTDDYKNIKLILCGHTHGGQIRLPFFGAVKTSTIYWKLFEYGHYQHKIEHSNLIITNGIGYTGIKCRFLCKPEIVRVNFI